MFNSAQIIGNLGADPEATNFESGSTLVRFPLYVNERYKHDGETKERVHRFTIEAWGKTADYVINYLHKGNQVAVSGSLVEHTWTTTDGQPRSKVAIKANRIKNLTPRKVDSIPTSGGDEPADDMEF